MRVLVLSHQYPKPEWPHSGIFVREQVAALRRRGVDARVLVGQESWLGPSRPIASLTALAHYLCPVRPAGWREEAGVPDQRFPAIVVGRLGGRLRSLAYAHALARVIEAIYRDFPFELIHAHTALLDGAAAVRVKARIGVPVVLTEHTGPFSAITATAGMRRRVRAALSGADRVLAVSGALARTMRGTLPDLDLAIDILPNGVDERLFRPRPERRRHGARATLLWIGFLHPSKRPLLALAAFAEVAAALPDWDLRLVGEGPLEGELHGVIARLQLEGRVRLEPNMDRSRLADAMREADLLLVTSTVETFSLVTIEALSSGVPVLSTRCGGPEEILVEPWLGELSEDGVPALAANLLRNARVPFDPERIRAYAIGRYGMAGVAHRLAAIYAEVLARSRRERKAAP